MKSQKLSDCGNKFISILSHVQKESIYSLQTTDQVYEANDLLHRMKAYNSILLTFISIDQSKIQQSMFTRFNVSLGGVSSCVNQLGLNTL